MQKFSRIDRVRIHVAIIKLYLLPEGPLDLFRRCKQIFYGFCAPGDISIIFTLRKRQSSPWPEFICLWGPIPEFGGFRGPPLDSVAGGGPRRGSFISQPNMVLTFDVTFDATLAGPSPWKSGKKFNFQNFSQMPSGWMKNTAPLSGNLGEVITPNQPINTTELSWLHNETISSVH